MKSAMVTRSSDARFPFWHADQLAAVVALLGSSRSGCQIHFHCSRHGLRNSCDKKMSDRKMHCRTTTIFCT